MRAGLADFQMIETRADLDALAQDLLGEKIIAIDTEADSFYHYFDKTCLIQDSTRRQIYLIDPLALGSPAEFDRSARTRQPGGIGSSRAGIRVPGYAEDLSRR